MIKVVTLDPAWPEGWDLADAEAEGWDTARVEAWITTHSVDPNAQPVQPKRPKVSLATADHGELQDNVWTGLKTINSNGTGPRYFQSAATKRELELMEPTPFGESQLVILDSSKARAYLTRDIYFTTMLRQFGEVSAAPTADLMTSITVAPRSDLPVLRRCVSVPVFAADRRLIAKPGWDAASQIYYAPAAWVAGIDAPADPTEAQFVDALAAVDDVLHDFPFATPADRAHAWALMLLPLVRELIAGPTPLHRVEAPDFGSGKSLLADVLLKPTISNCQVVSETEDEEEWRKLLVAALRSNTQAIKIDNCRHLNSGTLAGLLTAWPAWGARTLGVLEMAQYPVSCVFVCTVNNPQWSREMHRRMIRIRLDTGVEDPYKRTGFRHKELMTYLETHRRDVLRALLVAAGWGLRHQERVGAVKGSYEAWARVMGDLLAGMGIEGFLEEGEDDISVRQDGLKELVDAWWEAWGSKELRIDALLHIAETFETIEIHGRDERARKTSLGRLLSSARDRVINGKRIKMRSKMGYNYFWLEELVGR